MGKLSVRGRVGAARGAWHCTAGLAGESGNGLRESPDLP